MKNDYKKRWEDTYGRNVKPKYVNEYYYNDNGTLRKGSKLRNIIRGIGVIILIVVILFLKNNLTIYSNSNGGSKLTLSNTISQSNKNGKVMKSSISSIRNIMEDMNEIIESNDVSKINTLNDDKLQIANINLSSEYDQLKELVLNRIQYAIDYLNTNDVNTKQTILKDYNSLDYTETLKLCFDKAGVNYYQNSNKEVTYYYNNK